MSTKVFSFKSIVIATLFIAACSSCSNNEIVLMNPQELCSRGVLQAEHFACVWNDEKLSYGSAEFLPVEGDSTKLELLLNDFFPHYEDISDGLEFSGVGVTVDVVPGENEIQFSGTLNTLVYKLSVQGRYTKYPEERVDLQCEYRVQGSSYMDVPYILRFKPETVFLVSSMPGTVESGGQTYQRGDFVKKMLQRIFERIANEVNAVQMAFHADGTADLALQYASSSDFTPWMTIRYWYPNLNSNLYLEFTQEQLSSFYDQWLGVPANAYYTYPFIHYGDLSLGRAMLRVYYWPQGEEGLTFWIYPPNDVKFVEFYLQGKGKDGWTEEEQAELDLLLEILQKKDRYDLGIALHMDIANDN